MNKKILIGVFSLFFILLILFAGFVFNAFANKKNYENITLGYCPTMNEDAKEIANRNKNINIVLFESTIDALNALKNNVVDIVLVGRIVKPSELTDYKELRLKSGATLVSSKNFFIDASMLSEIEIHTYLNKTLVNSVLPQDSNVIYYESIKDAEEQGLKNALLINWDDFKDEYEFIVVMNGLDKAKEFRLPVLYSLNYNFEKLDLPEFSETKVESFELESELGKIQIELNIESFESDKKTYGSMEDISFFAKIISSKDISNTKTKIFGIKPYNNYYIKINELVDLKKGENILEFRAKIPSCTSGCGGVNPGSYNIKIELYFEDYLLANETLIIDLTK